ncbi:hypothetical protein BJV78DRAFT_836064 [Lactifluus subvellereus]|nr:hypothetical protein BJV78DRAFT_836064 [Lactifluus subvellereus]
MTSIHTAPEFDFFWWSDASPAEDHTTIWSDAVPDQLRDQHLGDLEVHTAALSSNPPNCGATFEDVDAANPAEIPSVPTSDIYLEDLVNDFVTLLHLRILAVPGPLQRRVGHSDPSIMVFCVHLARSPYGLESRSVAIW